MRRSVLFIIIFLVMLALSVPGLADQVLTIELDPSPDVPQKQSESNIRLNHETLDATRKASDKQYAAQVQGSKQSSEKEVSIGRVGIVTASKADIKSAPSSRGRTLFTCPKDTSLAIVGENAGWYGVLMIDSSTGWVEKSKVNLLNYQVVGQASQSSGLGSRLVNTALKYLGISYQWGGYSRAGLDCSGFVKAVFASHGIELPRVSRDQALTGTPVSWSNLQPGDRLYFATKGSQIDHAGIYMGNGLFIHSSRSGGGVVVESITKPFYLRSLVAARRS